MIAREANPAATELRPEDFRMVADLVHREAGIVVRDHKHAMVRGRLARRARELGIRSISEYCARLRGEELARELPGLVNALTTNHTAFFREAHHFRHLEEVALPELMGEGVFDGGRFRIWSAAASSGEEPYTIAATVAAHAGGRPLIDCRILATDIDTEMLAKAERGVYPRAALEALEPGQAERLAAEPSDRTDAWRVPDRLRKLVSFRRLNVIEEWPFAGPFQIIFCRNMLIYFDGPTKRSLVARLSEHLAEGGYLYLGHSEALPHSVEGLRPCGRTTYRKH